MSEDVFVLGASEFVIGRVVAHHLGSGIADCVVKDGHIININLYLVSGGRNRLLTDRAVNIHLITDSLLIYDLRIECSDSPVLYEFF